VMLLTLPGLAFVYAGEEIGQEDGPPGEVSYDRAGRDAHRHPVQWNPEPRRAGFTTGEPWLAPVDAPARSVAAQRGVEGSLLELYRALIALRTRLGAGLELLEAPDGLVAYERGEYAVAVNTTAGTLPCSIPGGVVLETEPNVVHNGAILARGAAILHKA